LLDIRREENRRMRNAITHVSVRTVWNVSSAVHDAERSLSVSAPVDEKDRLEKTPDMYNLPKEGMLQSPQRM